MKLGMRPQDIQSNPMIQMMRQPQTDLTGLQGASKQQPGKDLAFGGQTAGGQSNPFGGGSNTQGQGVTSTQGLNPFEGLQLGQGSGIKSKTTGMDNPMFQASLDNRQAGTGNVSPVDPSTATVGRRLSLMG